MAYKWMTVLAPLNAKVYSVRRTVHDPINSRVVLKPNAHLEQLERLQNSRAVSGSSALAQRTPVQNANVLCSF